MQTAVDYFWSLKEHIRKFVPAASVTLVSRKMTDRVRLPYPAPPFSWGLGSADTQVGRIKVKCVSRFANT